MAYPESYKLVGDVPPQQGRGLNTAGARKDYKTIETYLPQLLEGGFNSSEGLAKLASDIRNIEGMRDTNVRGDNRSKIIALANMRALENYYNPNKPIDVPQQVKQEPALAVNQAPTPVQVPVNVNRPQVDEDKYLGGLVARFGSIGNAIAANPKLVDVNNPKVAAMLKGEAAAAQQVVPTISREEYLRQMAPVDMTSYAGGVPQQAAPVPRDGLAGYSAKQVEDMSRAANMDRMRSNASYADAVGKLFGY